MIHLKETISLTGTSGFVGKHLVASLQKSYGIQPINWRTTSFPPITGVACVHLAGIAKDTTSIAPETYRAINYEKTVALYDQFLQETHCQKFIFISSSKVATDVTTPYVVSKHKAEAYITHKILPEQKFFYIIRPSILYGKGCKNKLKYLAWWGKLGLPWVFDNPRYAVLYVENLCWLIQYIIEHDLPSGIYTVADEPNIHLADFVLAWRKKPLSWIQELTKNVHLSLGIKAQIVDTKPLYKHITQPLPFTTFQAIAHLRNS